MKYAYKIGPRTVWSRFRISTWIKLLYTVKFTTDWTISCHQLSMNRMNNRLRLL